MEPDKLIQWLNWFYSLEQSQVELYATQAKSAEDPYLAQALERFADIEQDHVDNIAAFIKNLGGKPTSLGDVVAPIVGKTLGTLLNLSNVNLMLKINIVLENKAMSDYKDLIKKVETNSELSSVLWANLLDEDLHSCWMERRLEKMEGELNRPVGEEEDSIGRKRKKV
ncbi:MAG TPA: ferritin-like domain-containing protein [Clostridia bacterium]|nr:ferritin-like domain-containing protein [Clostridia bacterium]